MNTLKQKLSSRKLWAAIVGVIIGIATIFGLDENVINTVTGAVVAFGSVIGYIMTEGRIDAARISNAVSQIQDAVDVVKDEK